MTEDAINPNFVARVNDQIITRSQLKYREDHTPADEKANALRELIDLALLTQVARSDVIDISQEVDAFIAANAISSEDLDQATKQLQLTPTELRKQIENQILVQHVVGSISSDLNVSEDEVRKYYLEHTLEFTQPETVQLSEILTVPAGLPPDGLPVARLWSKAVRETKLRAVRIRALIIEGEDFATAARQFSQASTADRGGDLGFFRRDELSKTIADLVFGMRVNAVSDVIATKQGFEIFKVTGHRHAGIRSLQDVQEEVRSKLVQEKLTPRMRDYLEFLRSSSFLQVRQGYVDTGGALDPPEDPKRDLWRSVASLSAASGIILAIELMLRRRPEVK